VTVRAPQNRHNRKAFEAFDSAFSAIPNRCTERMLSLFLSAIGTFGVGPAQ